eukprot:scaffold131776_cov19-Tisochrysis_lutea.AAC.2
MLSLSATGTPAPATPPSPPPCSLLAPVSSLEEALPVPPNEFPCVSMPCTCLLCACATWRSPASASTHSVRASGAHVLAAACSCACRTPQQGMLY